MDQLEHFGNVLVKKGARSIVTQSTSHAVDPSLIHSTFYGPATVFFIRFETRGDFRLRLLLRGAWAGWNEPAPCDFNGVRYYVFRSFGDDLLLARGEGKTD